jgi:choline dehydrogenase-like flavoprotein
VCSVIDHYAASVQVLELSGIGDPEVLRKAGVDVVVDLQGVGNNVQEHYNVCVSYRAPIPSCFYFCDHDAEHFEQRLRKSSNRTT